MQRPYFMHKAGKQALAYRVSSGSVAADPEQMLSSMHLEACDVTQLRLRGYSIEGLLGVQLAPICIMDSAVYAHLKVGNCA